MATLDINIHDRVATVWMNRPQAGNAFNEAMILELTQAFQDIQNNDQIRVMILAARGKSFSAGADVEWMREQAHASIADNERSARALATMLHGLAGIRKPTIARVQGAAIGGGLGLVCACDMALASDTAQFGTTEVRLGLIPSVIGPFVIRAIGARQARRYFLTGERFTAETAKDLHVVHDVVAELALDDTLAQWVANLQQGAPQAIQEAKDLIQDLDGKEINARLAEITAQRIARIRASPEAQEGLNAFLSKRAPAWSIR